MATHTVTRKPTLFIIKWFEKKTLFLTFLAYRVCFATLFQTNSAQNYGIVRYLYMRLRESIHMSQLLVQRLKRSDLLLLQDLYFPLQRTQLKTSVKAAVCNVCRKGLDDGLSVTAKKIGQKTNFFCKNHLPV